MNIKECFEAMKKSGADVQRPLEFSSARSTRRARWPISMPRRRSRRPRSRPSSGKRPRRSDRGSGIAAAWFKRVCGTAVVVAGVLQIIS